MDLAIEAYKNLTIDYSCDNWIRIPQIRFYGRSVTSLNGRYTLAWMAGTRTYDQRGELYNQNGTYILFDKKEIILIDDLESPEYGKVSNNGIFVFNDSMFSDVPQSFFYAIDRQGNTLIKHRFSANIFNNGLSPEGRFAVCQTCNTNNEDGNILWFFDLYKGNLLWKNTPEGGRASFYEFDVGNGILYLIYDNPHRPGKYSYSF